MPLRVPYDGGGPFLFGSSGYIHCCGSRRDDWKVVVGGLSADGLLDAAMCGGPRPPPAHARRHPLTGTRRCRGRGRDKDGRRENGGGAAKEEAEERGGSRGGPHLLTLRLPTTNAAAVPQSGRG